MIARSPRDACRLLAFGIAAAALAASLAPVPALAGEPLAAVSPSPACAPHAAEAAARSALPATVILRVMHVESRGRANAISPKGAMGCMQIMPSTWRYLTARYALGSDPWNARFNMIGGALYLAELARQFGFPGAYAAYNAGPARYARHVRGDGRLPAETVAYVASLSGAAPPRARLDNTTDRKLAAPRWQEGKLFLDKSRSRVSAPEVPTAETAARPARHDLFPLARAPHGEEDEPRAQEK